MLRVLITGSSGFLGSHLCDQLLAKGYDVVPTDIIFEVESHLDVRYLSNFESVFNKFEGEIEGVVHLAALVGSPPSKKEPYKFLKTNLYGVMNLLEAMRLHKVKKLLYISSFDVYDFRKVKLPVDEETPTYPESPYGASKICSEILVKLYSDLYDIKSVILRLSGPLYGSNQEEEVLIKKIVNHMITGETFEVWGNVTRCFLHVHDAANACLKALEYLDRMKNPWEDFLVVTKPVSTSELVDIAKQISPLDVVFVKPPEHIAKRLVDQNGLGEKFSKLTGWRQQVSIQKGLRESYEARR